MSPELTCEQASESYLGALAAQARKDHVPLSGFFDITYRCNYRCSHCYVGGLVSRPASRSGELDTRQVTDLLAGAADAGCLFLTFSGGDPLIRQDFPHIYERARRLGLVVSVYTNASLVSDQHLEVLCEYPPRAVEVSVYGATQATYERVTGVKGSFARAMKGLELLLDRGLPVKMKTMILRDNLDEVEQVEALAAQWGVDFRMDARVAPRLDGEETPLSQRVEPERAVAVELRDDGRKQEIADYRERQMAELESTAAAAERFFSDRLYVCGAGVASFHLDHEGVMRPCLFSRSIAYNAVAMSFGEAWRSVSDAIAHIRSVRPTECAGCTDIILCGYCPGLLELESPAEPRVSEFSCRLGRARRGMIERARPEAEYAAR